MWADAGHGEILASMRPPQFAGESRKMARIRADWRHSFNEAPAVRGGKWAFAPAAAPASTTLQ